MCRFRMIEMIQFGAFWGAQTENSEARKMRKLEIFADILQHAMFFKPKQSNVSQRE